MINVVRHQCGISDFLAVFKSADLLTYLPAFKAAVVVWSTCKTLAIVDL